MTTAYDTWHKNILKLKKENRQLKAKIKELKSEIKNKNHTIKVLESYLPDQVLL